MKILWRDRQINWFDIGQRLGRRYNLRDYNNGWRRRVGNNIRCDFVGNRFLCGVKSGRKSFLERKSVEGWWHQRWDLKIWIVDRQGLQVKIQCRNPKARLVPSAYPMKSPTEVTECENRNENGDRRGNRIRESKMTTAELLCTLGTKNRLGMWRLLQLHLFSHKREHKNWWFKSASSSTFLSQR